MEEFLQNWRWQGPIFKLLSLYGVGMIGIVCLKIIRSRDRAVVGAFMLRAGISTLMLTSLVVSFMGAKILAGHFVMGESKIPMIPLIAEEAARIFKAAIFPLGFANILFFAGWIVSPSAKDDNGV